MKNVYLFVTNQLASMTIYVTPNRQRASKEWKNLGLGCQRPLKAEFCIHPFTSLPYFIVKSKEIKKPTLSMQYSNQATSAVSTVPYWGQRQMIQQMGSEFQHNDALLHKYFLHDWTEVIAEIFPAELQEQVRLAMLIDKTGATYFYACKGLFVCTVSWTLKITDLQPWMQNL